MQTKLVGSGILLSKYGETFQLSFAEARELRAFLEHNYQKLRPNKNWTTCPYESHSDDCDCNGVGGDR